MKAKDWRKMGKMACRLGWMLYDMPCEANVTAWREGYIRAFNAGNFNTLRRK
jgi:hypothetical protein